MEWLASLGLDWWELLWFEAVTVTLHAGVVGLLGGALVLVEKYGLFQSSKIQTKPLKAPQPSLARCVKHLVRIHFVMQPITLPVFYLAMKWRGMDFTSPVPPWLEIAVQIPLFILVDDAAFYWFHRLFHLPFLYQRFHKMHHRYKQPIGLAVEYFHPTELLFANTLPTVLGPFLLRSHIKTFWIWLVIRLSEAIDGHSGYDFWFMPFRYFPFRPGANVHDYHHSHNMGNYGSFFTFWDRICGTDLSYADYQAMGLAKHTDKNE